MKSVNFEKDFYKLMNNTVFGKTKQNIQKQIDVRLCSDAKKVEAGGQILGKSGGSPDTKDQGPLQKPIYLGMNSLNLSKTLMYG